MPHKIVVIGGSSGSGRVLSQLVADLPADLDAAVLIVTHTPAGAPPYLAARLARDSALPIASALDGQPIEAGHIYVAPADHHLLVVDGAIRLGHGPRENMVRPAIDPLFRSAAAAYGPLVIGVVLTGFLNDGAAGLHAVKACGGLAVVQHPLDAEADQMPLAALEAANVDHIANVEGLGPLIARLVAEDPPERPEEGCSRSLNVEVAIALGERLGAARLSQLAVPTAISCPHCHGVLSEMKGEGPLRYRCQIGHAYTAEATHAAQAEEVDEAVGVALRVMEERCTLVGRMAEEARLSGRLAVAELYDGRAAEYGRYAATLREAANRSMTVSSIIPPID